MTNKTRLGEIGNCYEYARGRRLAGTDKMTVDEMLAYSRQWSTTHHEHVGCATGRSTWAKNGQVVPAPKQY